jgi:flagellar basal-body rod protein FlgC
MIDPIDAAIKIAGSGLETQSARLRIVAENLANAQSTGSAPGADPYARKTVTFESELDQATGANLVRIKRVGVDRTPFRVEHDPGSPAADSNGFVKFTNVELLVEMADLREANRSYEANLQVIKQTNSLSSMTIDLLRNSSRSLLFLLPVLCLEHRRCRKPCQPRNSQRVLPPLAPISFKSSRKSAKRSIRSKRANRPLSPACKVRHRFNMSSSR